MSKKCVWASHPFYCALHIAFSSCRHTSLSLLFSHFPSLNACYRSTLPFATYKYTRWSLPWLAHNHPLLRPSPSHDNFLHCMLSASYAIDETFCWLKKFKDAMCYHCCCFISSRDFQFLIQYLFVIFWVFIVNPEPSHSLAHNTRIGIWVRTPHSHVIDFHLSASFCFYSFSFHIRAINLSSQHFVHHIHTMHHYQHWWYCCSCLPIMLFLLIPSPVADIRRTHEINCNASHSCMVYLQGGLAYLASRRNSRDSMKSAASNASLFSNEDIGPLAFQASARGRQRRTSNFLELPGKCLLQIKLYE